MLNFPSESGDELVVSLSLRDVPGDFCHTYDLALSIFDGRLRQRNINQATILVLANGFVMVDMFPAPDTSKSRRFLIMLLQRYENCNGLADDYASVPV